MRATNRLSASFVKGAPFGKHCDGAGLWLIKREDGGAQWVLRVTVRGRRREIGLGGYPSLSLANARIVAQRWRSIAAEGRDPVKEREAEARAARREDISLMVLTADAFEARKAELKDDGKVGRWLSPLAGDVLPKLGKVPITDIDQRDIRDTLSPIWHTKADTARKAMNRLGGRNRGRGTVSRCGSLPKAHQKDNRDLVEVWRAGEEEENRSHPQTCSDC